MKLKLPCLLALALASAAAAAVLPPEKLLPKDTVAVVTAPDATQAWAMLTNAPSHEFWRDPALLPFRDKFMAKFNADAGQNFEKETGLKLDELFALLQGQATLAVITVDPAAPPKDRYSPVLIIDTKDHAAQLKKTIASIKKKLGDSGKTLKSRKIRDLDFTTIETPDQPALSASGDDTNSVTPKADSGKKRALIFGQVDSLLLMTGLAPAIEKILSRQSGGLTPALEENPSFQSDFNARLHGAPFYAWVDVKSLIDAFVAATPAPSDDSSTPAKSPTAILGPLGFADVTSASITWRGAAEGMTAEFHVSCPEAKRRGLIKAIAPEAKDAYPPAFVPADAIKYWRWRLDLPSTWTTLEKTVGELSPQGANYLNFFLQSAGKDKDEKYDLRAALLASLGNDIISYQKAPRDATVAALKSPPSIALIGSPNPDNLAAAVKVAVGVIAQGTGGVQDREFLGRKIFFFSLPGIKGAPAQLSFAASAGYVAFSTDSAMLEEFLRNNAGSPKPLSETPGLADAAQKAGGASTGFFAFDNQAETMKSLFALFHSDSFNLADFLSPTGVPGAANPAADKIAHLSDWADVSLLPNFDAVSKYFYFSVDTMRFGPDGFSLTIFMPTPPKLRQ